MTEDYLPLCQLYAGGMIWLTGSGRRALAIRSNPSRAAPVPADLILVPARISPSTCGDRDAVRNDDIFKRLLCDDAEVGCGRPARR